MSPKIGLVLVCGDLTPRLFTRGGGHPVTSSRKSHTYMHRIHIHPQAVEVSLLENILPAGKLKVSSNNAMSPGMRQGADLASLPLPLRRSNGSLLPLCTLTTRTQGWANIL